MKMRELNSYTSIRKTNINYLIFGIIIALMPLLKDLGIIQTSTLTVLGTVMFYSIVGMGLTILLGFSGLVSLGTAGFMGLGSYLAAYMTMDMKLPFFVSLLISVFVPVIIGVLVGLVSLRIEGYYLAIATLGVSEIIRRLFEIDQFTNGYSGKNGYYPEILGVQLDKNYTFILITVFLVLVMVLSNNFLNARTGRALLAMKGSEPAAQAMGINILKYKLTAFVVATLYAALGGVLYNHFIKYTYPDSWNIMLSLNFIGLIIIGGYRSLFGAFLGAFIVFGFPELVLKKIPFIASIDGLQYVMSGVFIIVVILFYPGGAINIGRDIKKLSKKITGTITEYKERDVNDEQE
jgi:branched-chain amino acid transport system permease protein